MSKLKVESLHLRRLFAGLFALFVAGLLLAGATTWYVNGSASPTGANGTSAHPWVTIGAAMSAATTLSGDTVEVMNGEYTEAVTMKAGVNMVNYPNHHPIIFGFGKLAPASGYTWNVYTGPTFAPSGQVYYTTGVPWKLRDLYGSWTKQPIARLPRTGLPAATITGYSSTTGVLTVTPSIGATNMSSVMSAFVWIYSTEINQNVQKYVTSVTDDGTTTTMQMATPYPTNFSANGKDTVLICNHPSLIRNLGDWAYNINGTGTDIYYDSVTTGNLNGVMSSRLINGVTCDSGCTVNGFEVTGYTGYGIQTTTGKTGVTIENCLIHDNGFGESFGEPGVYTIGTTNTVVQNCEIFGNQFGMFSTNDSGLLVKNCDIGYDEEDGIDLGTSGGGTNTNGVYSNCYIHNHIELGHPDSVQADNLITNLTFQNCFINVGFDSLALVPAGGAATNNVFCGNNTEAIRFGGGASSGNVAANGNTYAFNGNGAVNGAFGAGGGTFTSLNSIYYRTINYLTIVSSSDYDLFWNGTDALAVTNPPWKTYFTQADLTTLATNFPQFEAHATAVQPGIQVFNNVPTVRAVVNSQLLHCTASVLVLDPGSNSSIASNFNINDVVECDGDGVVRTISAVDTTTYPGHTKITFSPALSGIPQRDLEVWDWPAGTTNLVLDFRPAVGSPALTRSNTGGQVGSTINTVQYAAGSFDGTGTRNIPAVPSGEHYGSYWAYPYNGLP